jgi:hypothetical protein
MTQIYQVAVMGKNLPGGESQFPAVFLKLVYIAAGQRGGLPTTLIPDEKTEGVGAQFSRIDRRVFHTTGGAYVSADILCHGFSGH